MSGVLGVDPGFRSIGIAMPDGRLTTIRPEYGDHDANLDYIDGVIGRCLTLGEPDVVMYEGPNPHGPGWQATATLDQVRGIMRASFYRHGIPQGARIQVPPARLKRWATGSGNASKELMVAAARQLGHLPRNDDEADAALLRALGLHGLYGIDPFKTADPGHRLDVISNMTWPVVSR